MFGWLWRVMFPTINPHATSCGTRVRRFCTCAARWKGVR